MRILLLGKYGQLGWELNRTLLPLGEVYAFDYPEIDLTRPDNIRKTIRAVKPEVIVNATAYTAVDQAESEPETAFAVNARAPGVLAEETLNLEAVLIHYSTDYVFDGSKGEPYREEDKPNPINVYGQSKLAGEQAIIDAGGTYLILRTSWVYGLRRESFVTKVLRWSRQRERLRIVADQISNPTWCRMLAEASTQLLTKAKDIYSWFYERRGIYHLAGFGVTSRLEWAREILGLDPNREEQVVRELRPALTSDFPTRAQRPLYSGLSCERFVETFGLHLPEWPEALRLAMDTNQRPDG
jgi:dTDP-4-dehydrorhamnose reductase